MRRYASTVAGDGPFHRSLAAASDRVAPRPGPGKTWASISSNARVRALTFSEPGSSPTLTSTRSCRRIPAIPTGFRVRIGLLFREGRWSPPTPRYLQSGPRTGDRLQHAQRAGVDGRGPAGRCRGAWSAGLVLVAAAGNDDEDPGDDHGKET